MSLILLPGTELPARVGRVYHRPVPAEWRQQLDDAYPSNGLGFPWLVWEPGYDWILEGNDYDEVVERWMLYDCVSIETLDPDDPDKGDWNRGILMELKGAPPESLRQIIQMANGTTRIIPGTVITQRQWEIYRETGAYSRGAIWCVQGTNGGVPMSYPPIYCAVAKMKGLPIYPPMPGTQPYADFDGRTIHALKQYESIKERAWDIKKRKKQIGYLNQVAAREAIDLVGKWLEERIEAATEDGIRSDADIPIVDTQWDRKLDEQAALREASMPRMPL